MTTQAFHVHNTHTRDILSGDKENRTFHGLLQVTNVSCVRRSLACAVRSFSQHIKQIIQELHLCENVCSTLKVPQSCTVQNLVFTLGESCLVCSRSYPYFSQNPIWIRWGLELILN